MTAVLLATTDADELRRQADEIVRRPEFRQESPSIVERVLDWLFEQLGDLIGPVADSGGGYLIGYLVLILALAAIAFLLWRVLPRGRLLPQRDSFTVITDTVVRRSRAEWLAEAERAEVGGEWDEAVHARYHAIATGLADGDQLPSDPSTTSGERRSAFTNPPHEPGRVATFGEATETYEHVRFGGRPAVQPDSRRLADADRSLLDDGVS